MICAYSASFSKFAADCASGRIAEIVSEGFQRNFGWLPGASEQTSWERSLPELASVLEAGGNLDCEVFVELQMPLSSARCDVLLVGMSKNNRSSAVVLELKQWSRVSASAIRDTVSILGRPDNHPSVQVRSYVNYLKHFHGAFSKGSTQIHGCAYLHNVVAAETKRVLTSQQAFDSTPREYPLFFWRFQRGACRIRCRKGGCRKGL